MTDVRVRADTAADGGLTVGPIPVPATVDAADARPFLELVRLLNEVSRAETGHDDLHEDPIEVLGFWHDQTDWTQIGFTAERAGEIVGAVRVSLSTDPDGTTIEFDLVVEPALRDQGIEEALLAEVEREARDRSRLTLQTWTLHRPETPGPRLTSPTGFGSISADDQPGRFFQRSGFTLGQVERNSAFDLRGDMTTAERMLAEATAHAGEDYRLVTWTAPTPPEHRDGYAYALSRMSTDVPAGELTFDEQQWDADRVDRRDARFAAQELTVSVAAVVHEPTGTIAAYNELTIGRDLAGVTHQYGTLVLKEHRGRRLGTIVKCANLLRWRAIAPDSPKVSTFNAEENRHMLDINEAIGFVPVSYAAAWKKVLAG